MARHCHIHIHDEGTSEGAKKGWASRLGGRVSSGLKNFNSKLSSEGYNAKPSTGPAKPLSERAKKAEEKRREYWSYEKAEHGAIARSRAEYRLAEQRRRNPPPPSAQQKLETQHRELTRAAARGTPQQKLLAKHNLKQFYHQHREFKPYNPSGSS